MSAVRCYAIWRVKEGVTLNKDNVTYFSPGGFSFIHKSGKNINFDFEESEGTFEEEDGIFDFNLKEIDNELITSFLEEDGYNDLIQEQYDINFFKDGHIDLSKNEFHCCMDIKKDGEILEEVDYNNYIEPIFLAVFDPYGNDKVVLYDKLKTKEYVKYML